MIRCLRFGDIFDVSDKMKAKYPKLFGFKNGFIVTENQKKTGGGTGHGPHDIYPDGILITFVPLTKSQRDALCSKSGGTRKGLVKIESSEPHKVFQTGGFTEMLHPDQVTLLGWTEPKTSTETVTYEERDDEYLPKKVKRVLTVGRGGWFENPHPQKKKSKPRPYDPDFCFTG